KDDFFATTVNTPLNVSPAGVLANDSQPQVSWYPLGSSGPCGLTVYNDLIGQTNVYYPYFPYTAPSYFASVMDGPHHGTLTLNTDGSFTYVPNADFAGQDTFTYRVHRQDDV